jgi:mRNA-degrading endonuclease RelE of RelBE toxin-antitoxin system
MAQLMLHREVLKGFGKLPSKVQKKVYELIRKFEEDSTQTSIHLEQLNPLVKDKKVRSARLGDDYRAIVIAPDKGDVFLLMYVDHHDKAYQWCANKQFEAHGALGTLQVFDVEEVEKVVDEVVTHDQIEREKLSYPLDSLSDEELFQAGAPYALIPAIRAVSDDASFEQLLDYLPKEAQQVLYGIVSGLTLDESLSEMLGSSISQVEVPTGPGDFSYLADACNLDLVLIEGEETLRDILSEDIEEWRVFLHPYQRGLVEWNVKGPMKINGAAGTGKTVVLMHRAIWLAKKVGFGEKILVTTYTTNLSVTIKGLLEKMSPELSELIEVTNLHQLARTICQRSGWRGKVLEDEESEIIWSELYSNSTSLNQDFSLEFLIDEYSQVIDRMGIDSEDIYFTTIRSGRPRISRKERKFFWKLFAEFNRELAKRNLLTFEGVVHQARLAVEQGKFPKYRYVLVDELQDFGLEALRLIASVSPIEESYPNSLCVVGDGHQRLYGNVPIALSRANINVRGRARRLKINYRTSEQIRLLAHSVLNDIEIDDLEGSAVSTVGDKSVFKGPEPEIINCESMTEAAKAISIWCKSLIEHKKNPLGTHEICVTPIENIILSELENTGIKTLQLKPRQRDPGQEEQGIRFGTKKRIKGLEFKAVVVIANDGMSKKSRCTDYVAMTRAREFLLVIKIDK